MTHRVFKVRCPDGPCGREFSIRVKDDLAGKRIKIECPGCVGQFAVSIPSPPAVPPDDEPVQRRSDPQIDALGDLFKTLEGFNLEGIFGSAGRSKDVH